VRVSRDFFRTQVTYIEYRYIRHVRRETRRASLTRISISRAKRPRGEGRKEGRRNADFVTSSNSHSGVGTPTPARYDEIEQQKATEEATEEAAEEAAEEEKEEKK